jgi:hypothetical protein
MYGALEYKYCTEWMNRWISVPSFKMECSVSFVDGELRTDEMFVCGVRGVGCGPHRMDAPHSIRHAYKCKYQVPVQV